MTVMTKEQIEALLNNDPGVLGQIARDALNTALALHQQLADAEAAQALVVERAAGMIEDNVRHAKELGREIWAMPDLRALADTDAVAELAKLRAERDEAKRLAKVQAKLLADAEDAMDWSDDLKRLAAAEAERDDLRARLAAAEAQVGALNAAVEGLIAVLDRNHKKGPISDVEMMFCWLAAQDVRSAFRKIAPKGEAI